MPHVIVKLYPGKSDGQKLELAEAIAKNVMEILNHREQSISVSFEEVAPEEWAEKVYEPDIIQNERNVFKKPGYKM